MSSQAEALGRKLAIRQQPLGGWLAKGSLVILFFALLQMLVPGVQIHRVPHYTSLFLWTSLALAFGVGLFFKDRAFCRGFCPVALLLSMSTLSVLAMLLLAMGIVLALREARLAEPARAGSRFASILLLGGFYFFLVFGWGGWIG